MDNILLVLREMSRAALKMRASLKYAEDHPEDPHNDADTEYCRDRVNSVIARFNHLENMK